MSSINTNTSAMNALSTLRSINKDLESTQSRISTGLKVESGKDNAAYFSISETMQGDSSAYSSINEGLTLTKNSVATARLGAETIQDLAQQFLDKISFAQGAEGGQTEIENDLNELVKQMETTLSQSTFNGDDMLAAGDYGTAAITGAAVVATTGVLSLSTNFTTASGSRDVVTGISRAGGTFGTTTISVSEHDLASLVDGFKTLATGFAAAADNSATGAAFLAGALSSAESVLGLTTDIATKLGQSEQSIENQQEFLTAVVDNIDSGIGAMIDADMEEEAARLQALQVQQQLATQSLSIANSSPQNILSLFQ
ncbi:flagellin [Salipiger sp. PrR002]|uniref:flagellin N-terminal helical domain-containing protein n=1 Tax=Salipiger sp. PrR002 TaxID=2706489 RepID=UPI0013BCEE60|nr:flagellin [Salipiger sp. PrR002]NDW00975.1 flagellar protein [Salipiger sp. PrR002]NDW56522.1 flagellar protein [Salipiger sp. PrR004]